MGIDGLLKFLRPITQKQHISSFKNQRAGIDVMSWIYRGCYSCNFQLSQNIQSINYLYYLLQMIQILSYYNIKPIFVFDGRSFPLKSQTNQKRIAQKQQNKQKAMQYLKQGNIDQARKYFSRCIFIDQRIISTTMNVMLSKNIQFFVAPYEADCQIAKLKKLGLIDVAISQDSDLIVYGVNTILKLNQNGDCDYIDVGKWAPRNVDSQFLKEFFVMSQVSRVEVAILAGSDYNPSIKGIGIKRAVKHLYRQAKMSNVINKLRSQKVYADKIPDNYQQLVQKVKMIFLFATVYNPNTHTLQYLNPDLLDSQKSPELSQSQLQQIVGIHYPQYIEKQVFKGKAKAKDLTPREINSVNIREIFSINRENMLAHQTINKKRRYDVEKMKQEREKQIKQGAIRVSEMAQPGVNKNNGKGPSTPDKTSELTQEEKQKRKQERKNRIIKLQDVMNSVVNMFQEEQKQKMMQKKKQEQNQSSLQTIQKKLTQVRNYLETSKSTSQQKNSNQSESSSQSESQPEAQQKQKPNVNQSSQSEREYYDQQSQSVDLAFLNPFAKKVQENEKTASKMKK